MPSAASSPSWRQASIVPSRLLPALFFVVAHRGWTRSLYDYLHEAESTPPELDPRRCHFDPWLGSLARNEDVHCTIDCLGDTRQAVARFPEMEALRDRLLVAITDLIDGEVSKSYA